MKQVNTRAQKKFEEARQKIRKAKLVEEARLKGLDGVTHESAAFNEESLTDLGKRKRKAGKSDARKGKSKLPRKL